MDQRDVDSVVRIRSILNQFSVEQVLDAVSAHTHGPLLGRVDLQHCTFDHYGFLVFPETISEVVSALRRNGFEVTRPVPSVVVKSRLCRRYRIPPEDLDVRIVRGAVDTDLFGCREIEVFAATVAHGCALPEGMADRERQSMNESHVAIMVDRLERVLAELRRQLLGSGALVADGAGYNPLEKEQEGGRSVLYFRATEPPLVRSFPHRLELTCAGEHADVIAEHIHESDRVLATDIP
ncbi:hypothetical protein [Frankia sp. CiP3]|uniref:hypothetical protein n=1 Tax=Frankia sp. CiP3 TaxID=2880971 RepID=UPI001EF54A12|nr:hypothetical protein [Frankia sp. CiP3]